MRSELVLSTHKLISIELIRYKYHINFLVILFFAQILVMFFSSSPLLFVNKLRHSNKLQLLLVYRIKRESTQAHNTTSYSQQYIYSSSRRRLINPNKLFDYSFTFSLSPLSTSSFPILFLIFLSTVL